MCDILQIARSTFYYEAKEQPNEDENTEAIVDIFHKNRKAYAVAEATYKVMKTEFIHQMEFQSLDHLQLELYDYVNWFNKHRIHGSLGYMTPVQYRQAALKKAV
ncbi:transposase InsO family protein [Paenibacillus rhizosphaerae]|uniref:Transposase InsO family protein n=1 Tax=Paenibacillus rhizosphaerae TaxID=297318 RepID=A0A839TPD0_9BACL|nr:transposase InsO family protein [Paenibacillus rhizosphaerae]